MNTDHPDSHDRFLHGRPMLRWTDIEQIRDLRIMTANESRYPGRSSSDQDVHPEETEAGQRICESIERRIRKLESRSF